MDMEYATEFGVEYDYDVLGGKPIYIIHLYGKDGCLAVGDAKKKECEIRGDTLDETKSRCLEIRVATQVSYDIAEKMREELGIIKVNANVDKETSKYKYKAHRYSR